jgi:threonine synthase
MLVKKVKCFKCGKEHPVDKVLFECSRCGYSLDLEYDYREIKKLVNKDNFYQTPARHWKYWAFYPIQDLEKVISMQEGGTPLLQSRNNEDYWFKFEGVNPTGVFKDRGSSVEISRAVELGVKKILCASTGNMGASLAAYAQRAGIKAEIYLPSFASGNKVKQIKGYGAKVKIVKGSYDKALNLTKKVRQKTGVYLTGDYPYRKEGQKSVAFEILDQLHWYSPANIVCPMGNGTLIYAVYKGCLELKKTGFIKKMPRLVGVQAQGCNPIVKAFKANKTEVKAQKKTKTIATAINCSNPVDGLEALQALKQTKGLAEDVTEKEIREAKKELGREGIYAETSSAATLAGAKKLGLRGKTVLVITGHGLKE